MRELPGGTEIVSRAPTRIDLAGGTLDIWPLFLFHQQTITVNLAINLYATARLQPLPEKKIQPISRDQNQSIEAENLNTVDPDGKLPLLARLAHTFTPATGFRLETDCLAPAGSGLGGSSALAIAVCGAFNRLTGDKLGPEQLIGIARDVEAQVLGIPTGVQDYYAATYGGLSGWRFGINHVAREQYGIPLRELKQRLLLFYSGLPRNSGINNWQVFKNRIDREPNTMQQLEVIHREAQRLHEALKSADWNAAGDAISREWAARKKLAPSITTEEIDDLIDTGIWRGAMAGRGCGAGGGGCLFLMMDPSRRAVLEPEFRAKGSRILEFEPVERGLETSERVKNIKS